MDLTDMRSSSNDLSSAPNSDIEAPKFDRSASHRPPTSNSQLSPGAGGPRSAANGPVSVAPSATLPSDRQETSLVKQRKPRKKKEPGAEIEKKEKVPRKPRAVSSAAASRKKPKLEHTEIPSLTAYVAPATDLQSSKLVEPVSFPAQVPPPEPRLDEAAKYSQNGFSNHDSPMRRIEQLYPPATPQPQAPISRSSAIYDPVRSVTIQRPVESTQPAYSSQYIRTPPRPAYHASTSPSISSIIDHPIPAQSSSSTPLRNFTSHEIPSTFGKVHDFTVSNPVLAMEVDPPVSGLLEQRKSSVTKKPSSEAPTRAPSPKPTRAKEQPPPIPPGSGLLSASLFGGESSNGGNQMAEKGPNIVLHVDLKDPKNKVINFARMAEEKYGFAALYPRQAAQKERLAKVAAAGAALERSASGSKFGGTSAGESGDDDVSVDIDRDSDNDGDIAMSGLNGNQETVNSGTDGPGPKRRRRRKVEEYDQDDPFVDDSEMLWEAQAAASKDGFFVYCGPLVPEGEKPAVERADGTVKRGRGRGRGGGPGSRGGRGGAESGSGRGGGPGPRGGGVTRKPRITKAERLQREQEKLAREKMAVLAAKPPPVPA